MSRIASSMAGLPDTAWNLEVTFTDDKGMTSWNNHIMSHEGTTDVITLSYFETGFPVFDGDTGVELFVNADFALREGSRRKLSDYPTEIVRYIVHGLLHATGLGDLTPAERAYMRRRERAILKRLRKDYDFSTVFPLEKH